MDAAGYTTLTRQTGLQREIQAIANNLANSATTGFRREGVIFAEHVRQLDDAPSLSMARASGRNIDLTQGELSVTGGTFDFAIQGEGFFLLETPQGNRLTRAGAFTPNGTGDLVNPDGYRLLDAGGAPVFVPAGPGKISLAEDGTLSRAGEPITRIGLWLPADPTDLRHEGGTVFATDGGEVPAEGGSLLQGQVEGSNVNPFAEVARMIEVQRAYEAGQGFLDREHDRKQSVIRTLGR